MYKERTEIKNQFVSLYSNDSLEHLYAQNLRVEVSAPYLLDATATSTLISCLLVSFCVGSYFKFALYRYMYDIGKEILNRPIDLLLLASALIDHMCCLLMVANVSMGLSLKINLSDYLGETWCYMHFSVATFGASYRTFGSLGVAILRLIYIKFPYLVRETKNRMKYAFFVLLNCLLVCTLIVIGFGLGNGKASRKQVQWNFCVGRSETFREIMHDYSLRRGLTSPQSEFIPHFIVWIAFLAILTEFLCYMVFFHHLYSHDKEMVRKKILPDAEIRRRHHRNAITFFGQFYGFLVELARVCLLIYSMDPNSDITYRFVVTLSIWIEFGVLSIVEVMTSQGLRSKLPHNYLST